MLGHLLGLPLSLAEADEPMGGPSTNEGSGGCNATGKPNEALLGLILFGALVARRRQAAWR